MNKQKKEPIKNGMIWIGFGILFVMIIPWYFATGSYRPLIWGIPYWAFIIIGASVILSAFVTYAIRTQWNMVEEEELKEEE